MIRLAALDPGAAGFSDLLAESQIEGHRMLMRFAENWENGSNRFGLPGEIVQGAWADKLLVGMCGRNIDPYDNNPRAGRVRHLYVAAQFRRHGIGRVLVSALCEGAEEYFGYLNTNAPSEAHAFYMRLGFVPIEAPNATHRLEL